jgi:ribosomal protein S12 methylthiotransferase
VLVDEVHEKQVIARSSADAPEIDGRVFIPGGWELDPGDFIRVRITGATAHDLKAEPLEAEED